jgi:hypothetical protein
MFAEVKRMTERALVLPAVVVIACLPTFAQRPAEPRGPSSRARQQVVAFVATHPEYHLLRAEDAPEGPRPPTNPNDPPLPFDAIPAGDVDGARVDAEFAGYAVRRYGLVLHRRGEIQLGDRFNGSVTVRPEDNSIHTGPGAICCPAKVSERVTVLEPTLTPMGERSVTRRPCLEYEPATVRLTGVLRRTVFPGPPNYESVAEGDTPEQYWVLALSNPICVAANSESEFNVAESDVRHVQLILADYAKYKHLVGRRVVVKGRLVHAITGHHHTAVLLQLEQMTPARRAMR